MAARIAFSDGAGGYTDTPVFPTFVVGNSIQIDVAIVDAAGLLDKVDDIVLNMVATKGINTAVDQSFTVQGICSLLIDGAIINSAGTISVNVNDNGGGKYAPLNFTVNVVSQQPPPVNPTGGAATDAFDSTRRRLPQVAFLDVDDIWNLFRS